MAAEHGLLDPSVVIRARPLAEGLFALLLWSNSAITTVLCCQWVEQQLMQTTSPASWAVGIALTVVLTVAQIFTKDANWGGYVVALLPDVATTALQHQRWLVAVLTVLLGTAAGILLGWTLALLVRWYSARLPERMLFGRVGSERRATA